MDATGTAADVAAAPLPAHKKTLPDDQHRDRVYCANRLRQIRGLREIEHYLNWAGDSVGAGASPIEDWPAAGVRGELCVLMEPDGPV